MDQSQNSQKDAVLVGNTSQNKVNIAEIFNEIKTHPELLEQFAGAIEDARPLTQPSIILKGGVEQIGLSKLTPKVIEQYLWMHPVIPRGIEIKANRMTSRGYRVEPFDTSAESKEAANKMYELLRVSGGEIFLNSWIQDGYAFGNGYLTLLPDKNTGEIIRLSKEHPVFFRIARFFADNPMPVKGLIKRSTWNGDFTNEYGPMKIDPITKKPMGYTQVVFADDGNSVKPIGTELTPNQVAHLVFDTWGDEAEGISLIQYVHLLLKYLMNIEMAGAEATYRSGFTQKVIETTARNDKDLKKIAKNVEQINSMDAIILPEGGKVTNLNPGQNQFVEIHDKFLTLIAIRLGIPKPLLTLDGTDTNKATMQELMADMIYDIRADEIKIKRTIEEQIFKVACEVVYGPDFEFVPRFFFNDFVEGRQQKAEFLQITSVYVKNLTDSYVALASAGQQTAAAAVLNFMVNNLIEKDLTGLDEPPVDKQVVEQIKPSEVKSVAEVTQGVMNNGPNGNEAQKPGTQKASPNNRSAKVRSPKAQ